MEAYTSLLERTRVPQPSLQRYALIQLFSKLRSSPAHLGPNSDAGIELITRCLNSTSSSPAVVEQSVRELCRLVKASEFDPSAALIELGSALEAAPSRLVSVFVQGIGFLVRFRFRGGRVWNGDDVTENHPFVKVLSCRPEVQNELVQQVLLFVVHCKHYGIKEVCDYLRPLVTFSILKGCSDSSLSSFLRHLISSLTSLCCSSLDESNPLFGMLIDCLRCFHPGGQEELRNFIIYSEFLVDAQILVLRHLVKAGQMVHEAHLNAVKLLDTLLTACVDFEKHNIRSKTILGLSKRLLSVQKELGLRYFPELFSPMLSLFFVLTRLELEEEALFMINLLTIFLKWKLGDGNNMDGAACDVDEVLLFIFPLINLISSPSKTVKLAASEFLLMLEKHSMNHLTVERCDLSVQRASLCVGKPEVIIFRLLKHLWLQDLPSSCLFLNSYFATETGNSMGSGAETWTSQVAEYASWVAARRKQCVTVSSSQEIMSDEMPLLLGALVCVLVMHRTLGISAIETLGFFSNMEPKLGVTLLLAILYFSNLLKVNISSCSVFLLKLLAVLPSLASHSAMLPLIVQTIMPMLRRTSHMVLYGTALRLLCKTWEINDKIFGSLHGLLLPESFAEFRSDTAISISMAASLRDICRCNPDKGVELILSVAACIECLDSVVKALGFQSLGYLCEADVVDFYTAWNVISRHAKEYLVDPTVAYSLCLLLRWGSMDAEAYVEASRSVLHILWDIGSSGFSTADPLWKRARIAALEAMSHFEVSRIESSIQDFKGKSFNLLISETEIDILRALGELEVRTLIHEHRTRRRLVKETISPRNKIEKLLDAFPRTIFSAGPGGSCNARQFPGAALFCLAFSRKDADRQGKSKNTHDVFGEYSTMMKEIAASLHLSRNAVLALLSLQSWNSFMQHWLTDYISFLDSKASSDVLGRTSKAANNILKSMIQVAEDSIPRVAQNIGLAMGAFCMVLPASAHTVKVAASKFLLNWLFQYEHEQSQWSAAIALGVISSCLHITDREQKLQIVNSLIEVACSSRNSLIKGACGVGLGYSCQDLLTRVVPAENAADQGGFSQQEKALLGKIVRTLSSTILQLTEIPSDILESLSKYVPPGLEDTCIELTSELMFHSCDDVPEDIWGIAGLVLGLGASVSALFRVGSYDAICNLKMLFTSWIVQASYLNSESSTGGQNFTTLLGSGACVVLPAVASFCQKVEMMHDTELNDLLSSYEDLISKLLLVKTSNVFHQNLLMASSVGAGNLLAWILDEGLISLNVQRVEHLLDLFKEMYSNICPHLVHLGGFLGVVNAMGAKAGSVVRHYSSTITPHSVFERKESSHVNMPLLLSSNIEKKLLELMQDIFLVAQNPNDNQLQAFAAWAMSFALHHIRSKEREGLVKSSTDKVTSSKPLDQSFSKDSTVVMLSSWLMHLDSYEKSTAHVNAVAAALRCLSRAPRLPKLNWRAVIRRCLKREAQYGGFLPSNSFHEKGSLRVECLRFLLAHANKFDSLLTLLDELTDLPMFRTLDLVMQSSLLFYLSDLLRMFSSSRIQKLFRDMTEYLTSPISSYQKYNARQKMFLKLSCWKGLSKCFSETSLDTSQYLSSLEGFMEVLFDLLPVLPVVTASTHEQMSCLEWLESTVCLGHARQAWLLGLLQISEVDVIERNYQHSAVDVVQGNDLDSAVLKKIVAVARLVKLGSLQMTELAKLKSCLLNSKSQGIWEVLVEVVAAVQVAEESVRKQWLLNALEISCMTKYPFTAMQFLGLLSGSCCKYMPFLVLDPQAVVIDIPVTLSTLLSNKSWQVIADSAVSYLWTSTERIYNWVTSHQRDGAPSLNSIDPTDTDVCQLLRVMLDACNKLKEHLPLKEQLRLANMLRF